MKEGERVDRKMGGRRKKGGRREGRREEGKNEGLANIQG